jgi:hypothetical protein
VSRNQSLEIAKDTDPDLESSAERERRDERKAGGRSGFRRWWYKPHPAISYRQGRFKIAASEDKQGLVRNNGNEDMGVEFADWQGDWWNSWSVKIQGLLLL